MQDRQIMGLIATFVAVAEAGSFKRAAEEIGRSPAAVSSQVAQLEEILGLRLLIRTTRRVRLSDAGEEFLIRGRRLLIETHRLLRDFKDNSGTVVGSVELSVSPTIAVSIMPWAIKTIEVEQPDVRVSLKEALRNHMLSSVADGDVDFGVGPYADVPESLQFTPLFEQEFKLILPDTHPIARRGYAESGDLQHFNLMCPSVGSTARIVMEEIGATAGLKISPRHESMQYPTLYALVAAGLGVTVMPVVDPRLMDASRLAALSFRDARAARTIGKITRRGEPLSTVANLLLETLHGIAKKDAARLGLRPL
jgi:DNA-binding transcriptional LysR family regulator